MNRPLYHFTCHHGSAGIVAARGVIRPRFQPVLGVSAVWMTDDPGALPAALGLQLKPGSIITCDRSAHRYRIDRPRGVVSWTDWREYVNPAAVAALESVRGTRPGVWYLSPLAQYGEPDQRGR